MQLGTHGPEHMPDRTPQRMPDRMSDRMSEYASDSMPDIMSESMSDRMSIGGDHSKKVSIFSFVCYSYRTSDLIYQQFLHVFHETRWGVYLGIPDFQSLPGLVLNILNGVPQSNGFIIIPLILAYILDRPHFQTHKEFTI